VIRPENGLELRSRQPTGRRDRFFQDELLALHILRNSYLSQNADALRWMSGGTPIPRRVPLRHSRSDAGMMRGRLFQVMATILAATVLAGMPVFGSSQPVRAQDAKVRYTIKNIGVLKGDTGSSATAINEQGVAVGISFSLETDANGLSRSHAVTYRKGKLVDLTGGDGQPSSAWAINATGQITGFVADASGGFASIVWDGTKTTDLPNLGGNRAQAFDINDAGVVVGGSNMAEAAKVVACRWDNGKVAALPSVVEGSIANAINGKGQITGATADHATLWDCDKATDLGTLGGPASLGRSINAAGQVVGHSTTTADGQIGAPGTHAFLWVSGKMTDLGTLPGSDTSFAYDINAAGVVVGSVADPDAANNPNPVQLLAVIWVDGKIANLNDLIPADSGWVLTQAYGINDKGQIVGFGYNKGRQRGFILTPVES
jgi:probable HAF family extracellular repeat protein